MSVERVGSWLVATAYAVLGALLCWTRFVGLDHSFWLDEIRTVEGFVRAGPSRILAGPELNHALFAALAWATSSLFGESEVAIRFWSVVPFVVGVALMTAWLHVRYGALSGLLLLFLATVSPLLLDITRQARGYGLAFFAMSGVVLGALEARRTARTWGIAAMCVAGVVGTWTLPQFGIAFVATGMVVLADRRVRRAAAIGLGASIVAIMAWYAPHLGELRASSRIEDGLRIDTAWLLTAPIDQVLLPALVWIDGTVLVPGVVWLPLVVLAALVIGSSPLARDRYSLLILSAGLVATIVVLWVTRAYVIPRYLSFLLVPLFVLLATGAGSIFARVPARPALVRTVVSVAAIVALVAHFATMAPDVVRLPREGYKEAAEVVDRETSPDTPVFAYMRRPLGLEFYLSSRTVRALESGDVVSQVCGAVEPVVYVMQPFTLDEVDVPCLGRPGVLHHRIRQYARGEEMNVWLVPPAS